MEPTTQSPPTAAQERSETGAKPLPATERDFRTRPSRTASPGFRIALVIAVIVLLVVGLFIYRYVTSYESTDDAQVDGHVNSISARISGHVVKLNVQDNQFVHGGTVLVEIDLTDYQVALGRAKADFEDARALASRSRCPHRLGEYDQSAFIRSGRGRQYARRHPGRETAVGSGQGAITAS